MGGVVGARLQPVVDVPHLCTVADGGGRRHLVHAGIRALEEYELGMLQFIIGIRRADRHAIVRLADRLGLLD